MFKVKSLLLASKVPAGRFIFSFLKALSTSWIVRSFAANFIGSIQTLTLSSLNPPTKIRPTFGTLENASIRYLSA